MEFNNLLRISNPNSCAKFLGRCPTTQTPLGLGPKLYIQFIKQEFLDEILQSKISTYNEIGLHSINQSFWRIESPSLTLQKIHLTLGKFEKRDFIFQSRY